MHPVHEYSCFIYEGMMRASLQQEKWQCISTLENTGHSIGPLEKVGSVLGFGLFSFSVGESLSTHIA